MKLEIAEAYGPEALLRSHPAGKSEAGHVPTALPGGNRPVHVAPDRNRRRPRWHATKGQP